MEYYDKTIRDAVRAMEDSIFRALLDQNVALAMSAGSGRATCRAITVGKSHIDYLEIVPSGKNLRVSIGASRNSRKSWYTHYGPLSKKREVVVTEVVAELVKQVNRIEVTARKRAESARAARVREEQVKRLEARHKVAGRGSNVSIEEDYYNGNALKLTFKNATAEQIDAIVAFARTLGVR